MKTMRYLFILVIVATLVLGFATTVTVYACDDEDPESPNCEVLPEEVDDPEEGEDPVEEPVEGTFTVDTAEVGASSFEGNLVVDGEVFEDVPAVCGEAEDVIYIGVTTPFEVCHVTDVDCINAMRAEQGADPFDQDQADAYGRSFDDIFEASVGSGDYTPAVDAFRWMTGNVVGDNPFTQEGDYKVSTWLGLPTDREKIQSLAWWIGDYCEDELEEPPVEEPPVEEPPVEEPQARVWTQANTGAGDLGIYLAPVLLGLGFALNRRK